MNAIGPLLAVALAAAHIAASAQDVQRCEAPDGKVTYANGPCPPGTQPVRTLPPTDAPSAADQKAARARGRQDVRNAESLDRAAKTEEERLARGQDKAQAQAKKLEEQCHRLQSRVDAAQQDLANASAKQRADAQRRLRRAEQQYVEDCGPLNR